MALLEIRNLTVEFPTAYGPFRAVEGVDLTVDAGEILGIVGESGSGKSMSLLALMGLVPAPGRVSAACLRFDGHDMLTLNPRQRRRLIGKDVAMIFQEPTTSLNPCFTIGFQLSEALQTHSELDRRKRRHRVIDLLERVGIPAPESRLSAFPHQLSGGMNQRVMIAMALACQPRLLLADEPTTALDVTIQAQILDLLRTIQQETGMGLVLVTHNMGVVAEIAERVVVMYAGQVMETRRAAALFEAPHHPYTHALLAALPERCVGAARLPTIAGTVPGAYDRPEGCLFSPRCIYASQLCQKERPPLLHQLEGENIRCHKPLINAPFITAPLLQEPSP
jgi:dipeptide transport system ATP-binding protein